MISSKAADRPLRPSPCLLSSRRLLPIERIRPLRLVLWSRHAPCCPGQCRDESTGRNRISCSWRTKPARLPGRRSASAAGSSPIVRPLRPRSGRRADDDKFPVLSGCSPRPDAAVVPVVFAFGDFSILAERRSGLCQVRTAMCDGQSFVIVSGKHFAKDRCLSGATGRIGMTAKESEAPPRARSSRREGEARTCVRAEGHRRLWRMA
ncbi:hypothetical protein ABID26_007061 [Mesorhizobium shonense]|uniref:Uncharacterized protein n=1 Tax=Mesorhizobium shonense TaxID=1209948 RepID=A0ABV2I445_9HYPH